MGYKQFILAVLLSLTPVVIKAEQQGIAGGWGGLHNSDTSMGIGDNEAQDLLNVDLTDSGFGIKKRSGYTQFRTIGNSTWPVRGGYYFRDAAGNDELVYANLSSIYKSVNSGAFSAFVTTDTAGSYYDFTDSNGWLYRATSNHDQILRYNGTTVEYSTAPKGSIIEMLSDRLLISGTTDYPNRLYYSARADFTDFTTGIEDTSAFTYDHGLPGQAITAVKAWNNGVLVWTKSTLSYVVYDSQSDLTPVSKISGTIGTLQPYTVIDDYGVVYFQAQDKHWYSFDGNGLQKISTPVDVSGIASSGELKNWLQDTQVDFDAGTYTQTSGSITSGSVALSTWSAVDTSSTDFAAGTLTDVTTSTVNGAIYLSQTHEDITNNSFETSDGWVFTSTGLGIITPLASPYNGTEMEAKYCGGSGCTNRPLNLYVYIWDVTGSTLATNTYSLEFADSSGSWLQKTISLSSMISKTIKLHFLINLSGSNTLDFYSQEFLCDGNNMTFYVYDKNNDSYPNKRYHVYIDYLKNGVSSTTNGSFLSQTFDTGISSPSFHITTPTYTANGHTVTFETQTSTSSTGGWDALVAWSTGTAPASTWKRYIRYKVSMSTTASGTGLPYVSDVALSARASTGVYVGPEYYIGSGITSWGNLNINETLNDGTLAYFVRSASTSYNLNLTSWTSVSNGSAIGVPTNAYTQFKSSFTITSSTQNPTLNSYTLNWQEGAITTHYGVVDNEHRLMWGVTESGSLTNSLSYIYDQRFNAWFKYDFPFQAPVKLSNSVYFGGVSTGVVYNWPSGNTDNGTAITSYWKSKDFIGGNPYVEKDLINYSIVAKSQTGSNLDFTYTLNTSTAIARNYSLTESNGYSLKRINENIAAGKYGTWFNFKFGNDDGDAPFEIYAIGLDYKPKSWRVLP